MNNFPDLTPTKEDQADQDNSDEGDETKKHNSALKEHNHKLDYVSV